MRTAAKLSGSGWRRRSGSKAARCAAQGNMPPAGARRVATCCTRHPSSSNPRPRAAAATLSHIAVLPRHTAGIAADRATTAAENIKVLVRVRPADEREMAAGEGAYRKAVEVSGNSLIYEGAKPFHFDGCCDEDSTQEQIFEQVGKPMTDSCLDGYNGAYSPAAAALSTCFA